MEPSDFIRKWEKSTLKESAAAQQHFLDLCALLDEPTPAEIDPTGENYCFEKGATKSTGGQGFADVWKREHFGWEYKGPNRDLEVQRLRNTEGLGATEIAKRIGIGRASVYRILDSGSKHGFSRI